MTSLRLLTVLTVVAAVAAGLATGVFLAFSTFVMAGLRQVPPAVGLTAMQGINRAAPASPVFMAVLFGGAVLALVLAVVALVRREPATPWLLVGAATYLLAVVTTIAFHVPRNDALALLDPQAPASATAWADYARSWTNANHVRTVACALACGALVVAARLT